MKIKYLFSFIIVNLVLIASVAIASDIQYPVAELGNCKNQADCKVYCDKPANTKACLNFAEKNNLMSAEELQQAKKFLASGQTGPGGCTGKDECEAYCNDIAHIDQCVSFAEKNGLMSPSELEEAKKIKAAIDKGIKPPACKNKKECDSYCEEADHMQECINFGIEAGFIQGKELEDSQKMLAALKKGIKPPPCKGKDACDAYCSSPDNIEVCVKFSLEAGMMTEEEAANSQKMIEAIKKGVKPPPCKGKDACDAYCSSEEHMQECIDFSVAAGMMSKKDAEMAKKTGGKGPGGCKGKDECEAFCNNPDNQETCFNFAKDNGMMSEEDLKRMDEGKKQSMDSINNASPETIQCLNEKLGANMVEKMKNGTALLTKETGDKMGECFKQNNGGFSAGPGGCSTPEECDAFCKEHQDECKKFNPDPGAENPGGQMMPQQAGPGGCKSPEECQKYCQENPESCKNYESQFKNENQQQQENRQFQQTPGTQMPQGQPCQGEECQQGPLPEQELREGQELKEGQEFLPSQEQQLQVQPQQPPAGQQPPTGENPPPPPPLSPPTSIINTDSFAGSLLLAAFKFLFRQ